MWISAQKKHELALEFFNEFWGVHRRPAMDQRLALMGLHRFDAFQGRHRSVIQSYMDGHPLHRNHCWPESRTQSVRCTHLMQYLLLEFVSSIQSRNALSFFFFFLLSRSAVLSARSESSSVCLLFHAPLLGNSWRETFREDFRVLSPLRTSPRVNFVPWGINTKKKNDRDKTKYRNSHPFFPPPFPSVWNFYRKRPPHIWTKYFPKREKNKIK